MKCDFIQNRIAVLFDDQISPEEKEELLRHISQCEDCQKANADYLFLSTSLKPDFQMTGGQNLIEKIISKVEQEKSNVNPRSAPRIAWSRIIRIAASIAIFLGVATIIVYLTTLRNPARAAGNILEKSIRAIVSLKSVYMVFAIRTSANENFESIDPTAGFINFKVWEVFGNESRWRFDKPGRSIIMDGQRQYLIQETGGYVLRGTPEAGFVGWMRLFLEPTKILETELIYAKTHPSSCTVTEKGNQLELTVKANAEGNFTNPDALNGSIPESNTRRVYRFDKESHMLTALTVFIESVQEDICVLKLNNISTNLSLSDSLFIFTNRNSRPVLTLEEWDLATARGMKDISGEEAVRIFFTACEKNDWKTVQRFSPLFSIPGGNALKPIQNRFTGSSLLQVGNAFTSGMYAGVYVPFVIRLKSGDTIAGNIAIRKDNSYHTWTIDGGY